MNITPPAPSGSGFQGSVDIGVSGYGLAAVIVGVLLLIITIALVTYCCGRGSPPPAAYVTRQRPLIESSDSVVEVGLDEATLSSYPKVLYSEAIIENKDSTATCCSICLADYNASDTLRVLPDCCHVFHLKCVDPWLRQHSSCPVCRTLPVPTPLATTPLAEVAPLTTRPIV